jgi:hypothetical protein
MVIDVSGMGVGGADSVRGCDGEGQEVDSLGVVEEVRFSSEEHQASFEQLTDRQKQYLAIYMRTGSPMAVAKEMGLHGSARGVGKRLSQIAKTVGLKSIKDIKPKRTTEQSATSSELMAMLKRQKYKCALSGAKLKPETAQLDHVEPLAEGGTNNIENLQWLDGQVNKAKGTMSQADFVRMCVMVAGHSGKLPPGGGSK